MSGRREALLARFRAGSLDRIRRLTLGLLEVGEGRGTDATMKDVARDLHTLKGESRMLGLIDVSMVAHAAEEILLAAREPMALAEASRRTILALDVVAAVLREDPGERAGEILAGARRILAGQDGTAPATPVAQTARENRAGRTPEPPADASVPSLVASPSAPAPVPAQREAGSEAAPASPASGPAPGPAVSTQPPASAGPSAPVAAAAARNDRWVQVSMARIDDLCGHVSGFASELRALFARLQTALADGSVQGAGTVLLGLREDLDRFRSSLEDITSSAWGLRLVPVEPMLADLVRHAHDLAKSQGKRVRVTMRSGAEVERNILDSLHEPLVHLVRNAIDHGIERPEARGDKPPEAHLHLEAEAVGASVVISVEDDGRGIRPDEVRAAAVRRGLLRPEDAQSLTDRQALDLLFASGFSTKTAVTEISGRGVGLDVVREVVEALGGAVTVRSTPDRGTRFELTVPAKISKEKLLVFRAGPALYGVPSRHVREILRGNLDVTAVAGGQTIRVREQETYPLLSMSRTLGLGEAEEETVMIIEASSRRWAFSVPEVLGEFELVRQPVDEIVGAGGLVSASATLDDGRLVLVLTTATLTRRGAVRVVRAAEPSSKKRILAVDDSAVVRDLVERVLLDAGFEVELATDGFNALQVLERYHPNLIISDIEMPGMDGLELLRRVRERTEYLPVIILSSKGAPEDLQKASSLGADAYLIKTNFEAARLLDAVRSFSGAAS